MQDNPEKSYRTKVPNPVGHNVESAETEDLVSDTVTDVFDVGFVAPALLYSRALPQVHIAERRGFGKKKVTALRRAARFTDPVANLSHVERSARKALLKCERRRRHATT